MKFSFMLSLTIAVLLTVSPAAFAFDCPLCDAARKNDVAEVKRLLANGVDVNSSSDGIGTALHWAVWRNATEAVEVLLANGANVNAKRNDGWTALYYAAVGNFQKTAEVLLANGADVNAKTKGGGTPLHTAAFANAKEIAELLLVNGADVNAKDGFGDTPLHLAMREKDEKLAELLLTSGANVNAKGESGWTAMHVAAARDYTEIVKLLLANGANIDAEIDGGGTVLQVALHNNAPKTAEILRNYTPGQFAHLKVSPKTVRQETDYVKAWCEKHGGELQAKLDDGTVADCLTDEYAVEFDFAVGLKSYQCAGQALHYADVAKRKPLCILIEKAESTISEFAAAVRKIPPQVEVRCMNTKGEIFDCPKSEEN